MCGWRGNCLSCSGAHISAPVAQAVQPRVHPSSELLYVHSGVCLGEATETARLVGNDGGLHQSYSHGTGGRDASTCPKCETFSINDYQSDLSIACAPLSPGAPLRREAALHLRVFQQRQVRLFKHRSDRLQK